MAFALSGARIFDGHEFIDDHAVIIEGIRISALVAKGKIPAGVEERNLGGGLLAPGYIDVQVNGGGGVLLNDSPSVEAVRSIASSHRRYGTVGLLPTVITDASSVTASAIASVRAARAEGVPGILGVHVEGPFLDPARKGAHEAGFIRQPSEADLDMLLGANCGVVVLTLAPNRVSTAAIKKLVGGGVRVSLGHAEANFDEVCAALDAGATGFTHLYNAMSQMTAREPGMVGAALQDRGSFIGIISDGYHVHDAALKIAFAATSHDRFMLVSDAMPPAAGGPDQFELQGRRVIRVGNRLQLGDGTLAGSNLTMDAGVKYCVQRLGLPLADVLRMASLNPCRFLGLERDLGHISPGALASLVHLDDGLNVVETWVEGK